MPRCPRRLPLAALVVVWRGGLRVECRAGEGAADETIHESERDGEQGDDERDQAGVDAPFVAGVLARGHSAPGRSHRHSQVFADDVAFHKIASPSLVWAS